MKRQIVTLLLIAALGLVSWATAQSGSSAPFDVRKTQQELEIMRGILNTTLGFVASDLRSRKASTSNPELSVLGGSWWSSNISAFYLYGQGAVFIVPVSGLRGYSGRQFGSLNEIDEHALQNQMELEKQLLAAKESATITAEAQHAQAAAAQALADANSAIAAAVPGTGQGVGGGTGRGVAGGVSGGVGPGARISTIQQPSPTPVPPAPPAVKGSPAKSNQEEMRKRLFEAQEKFKQRREEAEKQQQKLMEAVAEAKSYLIEALANHGDSLTSVKPNEYINLILTTDEMSVFLPGSDEPRTRREVISVQKSVITDYKAGRLSLEAFKQRVLQYKE